MLAGMELVKFQPTRPLQGATHYTGNDGDTANFNPRAPCGARLRDAYMAGKMSWISTHAPLAGRDRRNARAEPVLVISTHAPLAGRDGMG